MDNLEYADDATIIIINENVTNEIGEKRSWQFNDTMVLINSVEAHYDELSHPKKRKNVWKNVCSDLVGQNIEVTPFMCAKKWQNLVRTYKACKDIKNKSGRGPVRFQFFNVLDNLLGSKPNFASPRSVDVPNIPTSNMQNVVDIPVIVDIGATEDSEESSEKLVTKRKYSFRKELLQIKAAQWEKRRQDKKENNAEKLNLKKIRLEIEERKVKTLEALLTGHSRRGRCNININISI